MYLQSIHLTRLLSRLITVKSLQSQWLNTELFSAECGSTLKPCRVASAELNVYPYIIPEPTTIQPTQDTNKVDPYPFKVNVFKMCMYVAKSQ